MMILLALFAIGLVAATPATDTLVVGKVATGLEWEWSNVPFNEENEEEADEEVLDLLNPLLYVDGGFYFDPTEINKMVIGCARAKQVYCPSFELADWQKVVKEAVADKEQVFTAEQIQTLKDNIEVAPHALQAFTTFCFGETQRRFFGRWGQPNGILFVPVDQNKLCQEFAQKYTFYSRMAALETMFPDVGAAFERHEVDYVKLEEEGVEDLLANKEDVDGSKKRKREEEEQLGSQAKQAKLGLLLRNSAWKHGRRHHNPIYGGGSVKTLLPKAQLDNKELLWKPKSDHAARKFAAAAKIWASRTCVRFQQVAMSPGPAPAHGLDVVVDNVNTDDAYVQHAISPRLMLLGKSTSTDVVAHEIGHALGLLHTQQRSDRDTYLTYYKKNLHPADHDSQYQQSLKTTDVGWFDWSSIMLYNSIGYDALHDVMVAQSLATYKSTNNVPLYAGVWPTGSWGTPTRVTSMDTHGINVKYDCYARDVNGDQWRPGKNRAGYDQCNGNHWFGYSHVANLPLCFSPMPAGSVCQSGPQCTSGTCTNNVCT